MSALSQLEQQQQRGAPEIHPNQSATRAVVTRTTCFDWSRTAVSSGYHRAKSHTSAVHGVCWGVLFKAAACHLFLWAAAFQRADLVGRVESHDRVSSLEGKLLFDTLCYDGESSAPALPHQQQRKGRSVRTSCLDGASSDVKAPEGTACYEGAVSWK